MKELIEAGWKFEITPTDFDGQKFYNVKLSHPTWGKSEATSTNLVETIEKGCDRAILRIARGEIEMEDREEKS